MIHIRDIDHIVLRVVDLPSMLRFYCEALGCHVERRQDEIGLVQLRAGRSMLDLVPVDGKLGRAGGAAPGKEGHNVDHMRLRPSNGHVSDGCRSHRIRIRIRPAISLASFTSIPGSANCTLQDCDAR